MTALDALLFSIASLFAVMAIGAALTYAVLLRHISKKDPL